MNFGENDAVIRKKNGLSQEEWAKVDTICVGIYEWDEIKPFLLE